MPDMALIGGLANSLNMALNISKAMLGIRDQVLMQEKVIELLGQIGAAQMAANEAVSAQIVSSTVKMRNLEKRLTHMKGWHAPSRKDINFSQIASTFCKCAVKP